VAEQAEVSGPKYRRIAEDLLAGIKNGEYPPGSRLPTKGELMARYQVAVNTVERAIKELRSAGVVETAQGAGMFVREPPDPAARPMAADQRIEDLESEVAALRGEVQAHARLLARIRQRLDKAGITLADSDQRDEQAM
jgi:DNA-binding GntR family transcriptional regulator